MQLLSLRPGDGRGKALAYAAVQVTADIALSDLRVVRGPRGVRIFSPNSSGAAVVSFSPKAIVELKALISEALAREMPYDRTAA